MRAFLAASLLFTSLLSCSGELSLCKQKLTDTGSIQNGRICLPVTTDEELIFSETEPEASYKKADPFLGLYLRDSEKPTRFPFTLTAQENKALGALDALIALEGKLSRRQSGLNDFGAFDQPVSAPGILTDPCCSLEGIITPKGVIEKAYIRHFLFSAEVRYGDAGIRLSPTEVETTVNSTDPFMKTNPFKPGDRIKTHNGKRVASAAEVMATVLFAAPGEEHTFGIQRDAEPLSLKVVLDERHGGGFVSDTYLERRGLFFNTDLTLTKLSEEAKPLGLCPGDRLIRVNGKAVSSWRDVRRHIGAASQKAILLFEREGFHFFIHLDYGSVESS